MVRVTARAIRRKKAGLLRRSEIQILKRLVLGGFSVLLLAFLLLNWHGTGELQQESTVERQWPPLVMKGGDPYIRTLMRTISASESNVSEPYFVVYGGEYVSDLSHHPNRCVRITAGPNRGRCSTAAGRYQFLSSTWVEKAKRYHPKPLRFMFWEEYSFEPEYQDAVVYAWLSDRQFWKADIPGLLRQGKLKEVLRLLSGTWTSLGSGIENNSMTGALPEIYQKILKEELRATNAEES